jgi:hypothetical protein
MKKVVATISFALIAWTAPHAAATGTMICKGGIVSVGDTAGEVVAKCGEPATRSSREEKRVTEESRSGHARVVTTVSIDDWVFNFGPNEFQYQVILENGKVSRMESLNYGY